MPNRCACTTPRGWAGSAASLAAVPLKLMPGGLGKAVLMFAPDP